MSIKTIPLSSLEENLQATLNECADTGTPVVVELPDHRLIALQAVDESDDLMDRLLESNTAFQEMIARSATGRSKSFKID